MSYWTCEGPVRGECGIKHRSQEAAQACCGRGHRNVKKGHGQTAYSDRAPVRRVR